MNRKVILWGLLCCVWSLTGFGADEAPKYHTTFIVDAVPVNTPHDASIYLVTDIDGWVTDKAERKFQRSPDGTLVLHLLHSSDTLQYKITRGTWSSVEARKNGRARPNRLLISTAPEQTVHLTVESWEDISSHSYTIYMYFLIIAAIQGLLLVVAINTIRNQNKTANSILSVLLVLITISVLGRASTFDPDVFNWEPKLLFVPELILFTNGPIFYLYIHKLLVIEVKWSRIWPQFIPFLVQFALYLPYLALERQTFIYKVLDKELFPYFAITGVLALLFNSAYWIICKRILAGYSTQEHLNEKQKKYLRFLDYVLNIKAIYLGLWLIVVVIYVSGRILNTDLLYISENLIDVLWLLFSLIIFALAYYAVKHPEVLREKKKYQDQKINQDEISNIKNKLIKLLETDQIYLKPELTLESMAHMIPTASHTLSRVINEQFDQHFTELINTYRVDEFIRKVEASGDSASFLEIAFSVGFNSKPTFNRAFKKIKGCTPRQYFKEVHSSDDRH